MGRLTRNAQCSQLEDHNGSRSSLGLGRKLGQNAALTAQRHDKVVFPKKRRRRSVRRNRGGSGWRWKNVVRGEILCGTVRLAVGWPLGARG